MLAAGVQKQLPSRALHRLLLLSQATGSATFPGAGIHFSAFPASLIYTLDISHCLPELVMVNNTSAIFTSFFPSLINFKKSKKLICKSGYQGFNILSIFSFFLSQRYFKAFMVNDQVSLSSVYRQEGLSSTRESRRKGQVVGVIQLGSSLLRAI